VADVTSIEELIASNVCAKIHSKGTLPQETKMESSTLSLSPSRIAFGSCNHQDMQNDFWPIIAARKPAAFVWGGDSIYADLEGSIDWTVFPPQTTHECATPDRLRLLYQQQLNNPGYRKLLEQNVTIFGTFDGTSLRSSNKLDCIFIHSLTI
jgi:hypothetical protein